MAKEVGDRAGEGSAYAHLGNADHSQGDYAKAIEYQKEHLAIAKEVGDRAVEGRAYENLGIAYQSQGD
jgi:tetratricopeptide (TPR) repeat protein